MKLRIAALATAGALGAAAFAGGSFAASDYKNQYPSKTSTIKTCADDDTTPDEVVYTGPTKLWPPNHKLQETDLVAKGDGDDDVTLRVTGDVTEAVGGEPSDVQGGDGGAAHDPDIFFSPLLVNDDGTENPAVGYNEDTGSTNVTVSLRAERSGKTGADGSRIYTINYTATFSDNQSDCSGSFTVTVPHDMSESSDRDGRTIGNN